MPPRLFDALATLGLLLGFAGLYAATFQDRLYGNDAALFCDWFALAEGSQWSSYHNTAYFRVARALRTLFAPEDPLAPLRWTSLGAGALGVAATYLVARGLGSRPRIALLAAGLLGFSPVCWFFSTTIEVHALHLAFVGSAACITLFAPWGRPWLAIPLSALAYGLTYFSHTSSPLLGPGWVLLCQFARARRHPPLGLLTWGLCAAAHLGALLLANVGVHLLIEGHARLSFSFAASTLAAWKQSFDPTILRRLWLEPYGLLVLASLLGALRRFGPPLRATTLVALTLPTLALFAWWGIDERGGYLLATAPFWAAWVAWPAFPRRRDWAAAGFWLALQAGLALAEVTTYARPFRVRERVERLRRHTTDGSLVLSWNDSAPNARIHLPGLLEFNLRVLLAKGFTSEAIAAAILPQIDLAVQRAPVILDRSYVLRADFRSAAAALLAPLEEGLRAGFEIRASDDPSWPLWVVTAKKP